MLTTFDLCYVATVTMETVTMETVTMETVTMDFRTEPPGLLKNKISQKMN